MKKIIFLSLLSTLLLSANTDNSKKNAIELNVEFLQQKTLATKKITKESIIKRMATIEKIKPNLKNELSTTAQLEFVALLDTMAKI